MTDQSDFRESVVYVLGAGFSRPLGLPLMSDFISKAKDLYFRNPSRYSTFKKIFELLNKIAVAHGSFRVDVHNIEEVLSILEMQSILKVTRRSRDQFIDFLLTVIRSLTPSLGQPRLDDWFIGRRAFGLHPLYPIFVASLLGLKYQRKGPGGELEVNEEPQAVKYSVVTLNYDTVLEDAQDLLDTLAGARSLTRLKCFDRTAPTPGLVPLIKLHGGVTERTVIAPTWNKVLDDRIRPRWRAALDLLAAANHIRVIGYSLPSADAYIRFLFKAAALRSLTVQGTGHLKTFHVVCLDDHSEQVKARFAEFVHTPGFRFFNQRTEKYLEPLRDRLDQRNLSVTFAGALEELHARFTSTET